MDTTHQLKSELYELTGFYPRPLGLSQFTRRLAQLEFFKESKNRVIHQFIEIKNNKARYKIQVVNTARWP